MTSNMLSQLPLQVPLYDALKNVANAPKWGFTIYRCDYTSDTTWTKFLHNWTSLIHTTIRSSYTNSASLIATLDMPVRSEPTSLSGATVEQIRALHTTWAESPEATAEQAAAIAAHGHFLERYAYCIHIDAPALASCTRFFALSEEEQLQCDDAYVNLVATGWPRAINQDAIDREFGVQEEGRVAVKVGIKEVYVQGYADVDGLFEEWAAGEEGEVCVV